MENKQSVYAVLFERYPELTKGQFGGFCVGDGWFNIIELLCKSITQYVEQHNQDVAYRQGRLASGEVDHYAEELLTELKMPVIDQVKEKFGSLRFYISGGDKRIKHWVEFAEMMSSRTCEQCGAPGTLRNSTGWIHVMCDEHEQEYLKQMR